MENIDNDTQTKQLWQKLSDRYPRRYQRLAVVATAVSAVALTAYAAYSEYTHEPSYQELIDAEYIEFRECLATESSAASSYLTKSIKDDYIRQMDLQFAFPEYQLDPELQTLVDQCRKDHPMPQLR